MATKVIVRANIPHGYIFRLKGRKEIKINGNANHLIGLEKGILPIGQYGITEINADEWEAIKKEFADSPLIKNGLVFAQTTHAKAEDQAREQKELRHGFEAWDSTKTPTKESEPDAA